MGTRPRLAGWLQENDTIHCTLGVHWLPQAVAGPGR